MCKYVHINFKYTGHFCSVSNCAHFSLFFRTDCKMVTGRKIYFWAINSILKSRFQHPNLKMPHSVLADYHTLFLFVFPFSEMCVPLWPLDAFSFRSSTQEDVNLNRTIFSALSPAMVFYTPLFQ